MKKQVKFAESQTVHNLLQDEALPRSVGIVGSKMDAGRNLPSGLKTSRPAVTRSDPQLQQHTATVKIPKAMTTAPFLKHSALTPAQREYLCTIAASYSPDHVRSLITQHYMNVLHRCIRTGHPEGDDPAGTFLPETNESNKHPSEVSSGAKHKEKMRNPGKSTLPKIPNRRARISNTSVTKQRKQKKRTTASPRRSRITVLEKEKEEDEDEGLFDSLSDCLSSLSVADWDEDALSDYDVSIET